MLRNALRRVPAWAALVCLASILTPADFTVAQDTKADAGAAVEKKASAEKPKKFRGRLPNYYRKVVDEKQRQSIYQVQEEYASRIAALRAQLDAIMKERDEKVTAVLTPEQLQKVEQLKAAAQAEREKKKSAEKKPAEK